MIKLEDILNEVMASALTKEAEIKRTKRAKTVQTEYLRTKFRKGNLRIRTLEFKSKDLKGSGKYHTQKIEIPDYREISRQHKHSSLKERIQLATEAGDVKISCSCPDWKWAGYQWMGDAGEYGIDKQDIPPNERNPELDGSLCKHLYSVLENLHYFYNGIARDFRNYAKHRKLNKR